MGRWRWNPRYEAYAAAQGNTPDEQMKKDEARWPGAVMCGFMLWIQACKVRFVGPDAPISDQEGFDAFLRTEEAKQCLTT